MKKYFLIIMVFVLVFLTGCGKVSKEKLKQDFLDEVENSKGYYMEGKLKILNNDDNYIYDVKVSYAKQDFFKVNLMNTSNNYEQTILRNNDGVFVITPSLNRSFKFKSEWPYNNSQSYLLQSLANDLSNDENYGFEQMNESYVFQTKVNYPNNSNLVSQKITLDNSLNLKKVEVLDKDGITHITFEVSKIDKKAVFADNYFKLDTLKEEVQNQNSNNEPTDNNENNSNSKNQEEKTTVGNNQKESNNSSQTTTDEASKTIDEALFPLYLPENTSLTNRETINTNVGQRVIMTFGGDNSFILVQENVAKEEEFTITPSYGEPYLLVDTVGALTDTSYTWISNGVEYYIVSDVLKQEELLEVAKSINVIATIEEK